MTNQSQQDVSSTGGPDVIKAALRVVGAKVEHLEQAQTELVEAKERLYEALEVSSSDLESVQRVALARRLYWVHPVLNPREVSAGLGFAHEHQMRSTVGPKRTGETCDACGAALVQRARSAPSGPLCKACEQAEKAERDADWESLRLWQGP